MVSLRSSSDGLSSSGVTVGEMPHVDDAGCGSAAVLSLTDKDGYYSDAKRPLSSIDSSCPIQFIARDLIPSQI